MMGFVDFCERVCSVRLTPAQRVLALVAIDSAEPRDLIGDDRALALALFGEVETIPPIARAVLVAVCGGRSGKSRVFGGLYSLWRALTADLSGLAPGEQAVAVIVAPDLRLARQTFRFALGAAKEAPSIADLIEAETSDGFTLLRPDEVRVSIECLPATRGGSALRGRTLVSAVLDEAAFFRGEDYQVTDAEIFRAVAPRVLAGGMVIVASTPWAESGLLHEEFSRNFAEPKTAIAAHAPTLLMNPSKRLEVERERERDPENARREFDAEFMPRGAGTFFDPIALKRAVDAERALVVPTAAYQRRGMAIDLGFTRNSSTGCVVAEELGRPGHYYLAEIIELRPTADAPLKPSEVHAALADLARRHGVGGILADVHYVEALREDMSRRRIGVYLLPSGAEGKQAQYTLTRSVLHEGRLQLPNHPRLLQQLSAVIAKPTTGGGISISLPRGRDGSHGDLVAALVGATWGLEHVRLRPTSSRDYSSLPDMT
jgi:hypothetical protein